MYVYMKYNIIEVRKRSLWNADLNLVLAVKRPIIITRRLTNQELSPNETRVFCAKQGTKRVEIHLQTPELSRRIYDAIRRFTVINVVCPIRISFSEEVADWQREVPSGVDMM